MTENQKIIPYPDFQSCDSFTWQLLGIALMSDSSYSGLGAYKFNDACQVTEEYAQNFQDDWIGVSTNLLNNMVGSENFVIVSKVGSRLQTYRTSNFFADTGNTTYPFPASGSQPVSSNRYITITVTEILTKTACIINSPNREITIRDSEYNFTNYTGCYEYSGWGSTLLKKQTILRNVSFLPYSASCPMPGPTYIFRGSAAPPPPPPLNMNCCDCNTISTILAEQIIAEAKQHEATRELIDRRTIEGLREINKMLQGMQINLNLQPIIDRLNELEANLWNGLKAGG